MKPGDLVRIVPARGEWILRPGDPDVLWEWGDQVAGECDCLVLWRGEIVPFRAGDLVPLEDG